jgi:pyridoxamine 5'-phosphate oxidase family protein
MSFSEDELRYLNAQPLARLATVDAEGQPDVVPVGITIDGPYIYIAGLDNVRTRKYRNVRDGNSKVSLVVDDLASTQPWAPRFVRIYGTADIVERDGQFGKQPYLRILPTVSWSWNLDGHPFTHETNPASLKLRRTVHQPPAHG